MNNQPIKMLMKESPSSDEKEAWVYDFITNTDTFDTFVLCWLPSTSTWMTVPVAFVTPVAQKRPLNE